MWYYKCQECGTNLDPGERCDCPKEDTPPAATSEASEETLTHK